MLGPRSNCRLHSGSGTVRGTPKPSFATASQYWAQNHSLSKHKHLLYTNILVLGGKYSKSCQNLTNAALWRTSRRKINSQAGTLIFSLFFSLFQHKSSPDLLLLRSSIIFYSHALVSCVLRSTLGSLLPFLEP